MVKLEITLDEVDYESALRALGSGGSAIAGGAAGLIRLLPPDKRDRLAVELVNRNSAEIARELESLAARNGVRGRIKAIRASAVE